MLQGLLCVNLSRHPITWHKHKLFHLFWNEKGKRHSFFPSCKESVPAGVGWALTNRAYITLTPHSTYWSGWWQGCGWTEDWIKTFCQNLQLQLLGMQVLIGLTGMLITYSLSWFIVGEKFYSVWLWVKGPMF